MQHQLDAQSSDGATLSLDTLALMCICSWLQLVLTGLKVNNKNNFGARLMAHASVQRCRVHDVVVVQVWAWRGPERSRDWNGIVVVVATAAAAAGVAAVRGQDLVHEWDVGDGEAKGFDSWKSFFICKCWHLKRPIKNDLRSGSYLWLVEYNFLCLKWIFMSWSPGLVLMMHGSSLNTQWPSFIFCKVAAFLFGKTKNNQKSYIKNHFQSDCKSQFVHPGTLHCE